MPTRQVSFSLVGVGTLLLVALLAIRFGAIRPEAVIQGDLLPAADAARLLITVEPVPATDGLITLAEALAASAKQWEVEPSGPDAFLQLVTDPDAYVDGEPLKSRPVWIVRYSGLSLSRPIPATLGGTYPTSKYHFAYEFIDARTGEELFGRLTE
jgi:hypothetical protein